MDNSGQNFFSLYLVLVLALVTFALAHASHDPSPKMSSADMVEEVEVGETFCKYLGTYMYLNSMEKYDLSELAWIPVVSFSIIVLLASIGLIPISFAYVAEIMPEKLRGVGIAIAFAMSWIIGFGILKYFAILSALLGMHSCILFFSLCSFMGAFFVIFVIPETMGRSFDEIQRKLEL